MAKQSGAKIRKVAMELDEALEKGDADKVLKFFDKGCEIEFLGNRLKGKEEAGKWVKWLSGNFSRIKFKPITIMVEGDKFFEEFEMKAKFHDGREVSSRLAEVLVFRDYKVKKLRLYFDMMDFMQSGGTVIRKMLIKKLVSKAMKGLKE
ncbi:MAG: nuclear transport factor 2 family protein [archaeon]|nr:MAG: nuclear transport factor 2 family protein [archaeon]